MTDITLGDKMGSEVMTLQPLSYQENNIVVVYICILLLYFPFGRVLIIHIAYKVCLEYINLVSLSIWPFVSLFICPSICQLLDQSFALNVFVAYISVTT